jgi:hypothetical protein
MIEGILLLGLNYPGPAQKGSNERIRGDLLVRLERQASLVASRVVRQRGGDPKCAKIKTCANMFGKELL